MKLTQEEKAIVTHYLSSDPSIWGSIKEYWPILIPIFALELYGLYAFDIVASGMGFFLPCGFMIWFFTQGGRSGVHLKSALKKYESTVSAISE